MNSRIHVRYNPCLNLKSTVTCGTGKYSLIAVVKEQGVSKKTRRTLSADHSCDMSIIMGVVEMLVYPFFRP